MTRARDAGVVVIDRCNLTILNEPGHEDLAAFLASHGVTVIASLPCYSKDNVDRQRGDGVYERSLDGLRQLNALGYGSGGPDRNLSLVYNPLGRHCLQHKPLGRLQTGARSTGTSFGTCSPWRTCRSALCASSNKRRSEAINSACRAR